MKLSVQGGGMTADVIDRMAAGTDLPRSRLVSTAGPVTASVTGRYPTPGHPETAGGGEQGGVALLCHAAQPPLSSPGLPTA